MAEATYQHAAPLPPPPSLGSLGRVVLRSLVPVICPPEAHHLADAIVAHMALTIGASPPLVRHALGAGLITYDLGAIPFHRRRAHKLDPARAETYFASWEHGPTPLHVQFARGINQLMSLSCYEQPAMLERVGYAPGPWIAEVTRKRLTVFAAEIRKQDTQILAPDPLRPGVRRKERV
ncbi:MAG: hypothetical protein H6Q90_5643 [Deltaproteobacteria bacterium]|nr:hypothetical protein [Deltaproteobacteria bacterium]